MSINHDAQIHLCTPADSRGELTSYYTKKGKAALEYARRGRPVFPCKPGGKEPLTKRGFKEATTNEEQIRRWWKKHPGANIGSPTGEVSDTFAVDHDLYKPEAATVEELEARLGPVPSTGVAIETGSGGRQYLFKYPKGSNIRNTTALLPGVDIRGEGGYILLPPSTTRGAYRRLDNRTLTDPPAQLVERLTEPNRTRSGGTGGTTAPIGAALDGPPILEGCRDNELTRIVGKLHDGTRTLKELAADLTAINEARCQPPLPERQVEKIARSIHKRTPCKPSPQTTPAVAEALAEIEPELWRREWRGMGELSARDTYVAIIKTGRRCGEMVEGGVRVSISVRDLALAAAVSKPTVIKAIRRLVEAGLIRRDNAERSGTKAGAFVLLAPRANLYHSSTKGGKSREKVSPVEAVGASGKGLRAPRLRWSAPQFDRITKTVRVGGEFRNRTETVRATIIRLGKGCGAAVDALERAGGSATVAELADALHKKRTRDLRRRVIARLEAAAVVECSGDTISLAADWLEALDRERARTGEIAATDADLFVYRGDREDFGRLLRGERASAEERTRRRHDRQREAYRRRHAYRPDRAPTVEELAVGRDARLKQREVDRLVAKGMARHFARAAVLGDEDPLEDPPPCCADGCITELEVIPRRPDKVDGIYHHPPGCPCWLCADDEEAAV